MVNHIIIVLYVKLRQFFAVCCQIDKRKTKTDERKDLMLRIRI